MSSRVICVQPISASTTHESLVEVFTFHGEVEKCAIVRNEATAFIQFGSISSMQSALMSDGTTLPGTEQRVDVVAVGDDELPVGIWDHFGGSGSDSGEEFERVEHPDHEEAPPLNPDFIAPRPTVNDAPDSARCAAKAEALNMLRCEPMNSANALLAVALGVELLLVTAF